MDLNQQELIQCYAALSNIKEHPLYKKSHDESVDALIEKLKRGIDKARYKEVMEDNFGPGIEDRLVPGDES